MFVVAKSSDTSILVYQKAEILSSFDIDHSLLALATLAFTITAQSYDCAVFKQKKRVAHSSRYLDHFVNVQVCELVDFLNSIV